MFHMGYIISLFLSTGIRVYHMDQVSPNSLFFTPCHLHWEHSISTLTVTQSEPLTQTLGFFCPFHCISHNFNACNTLYFTDTGEYQEHPRDSCPNFSNFLGKTKMGTISVKTQKYSLPCEAHSSVLQL